MQSGSQSTSSPGRQTSKFADFLGVLIALLTLTLPLLVIAHYSSSAEPWQSTPYSLQDSK